MIFVMEDRQDTTKPIDSEEVRKSRAQLVALAEFLADLAVDAASKQIHHKGSPNSQGQD